MYRIGDKFKDRVTDHTLILVHTICENAHVGRVPDTGSYAKSSISLIRISDGRPWAPSILVDDAFNISAADFTRIVSEDHLDRIIPIQKTAERVK